MAAQVRRSAPGMTDVVLDPLDDTRVHPFSYSDAIDLAAAVTGADRARTLPAWSRLSRLCSCSFTLQSLLSHRCGAWSA